MKKKSIWLLAALLIVGAGLGIIFMKDKVSVSASSIALAEQGWKANFSSSLHSDAVKKGDLFLTDSEGEEVDVEMVLHENGKTLEIPTIPIGEYTLHIRKSAVKSSFLKTLTNTEIPFIVRAELSSLSDKEELEFYFEQLLELQRNNERYGAFRSDGANATEESASSDSADGETGGGDYSTTNNQVEGVDEADRVKTDGSYLFSLSESSVVISDVRDPAAMAVAEEISFDEEMYPQQLLLTGDTLVVLGSQYSTIPAEESSKGGQQHIAMSSVHLYNVSDPASPELIRTFGTEGNLNGSRLSDGILYMVTNVYPAIWRMGEGEEVELRPRTFDSEKGEEFSLLPYDRISILPGTMEGSYSLITAIDLENPKQSEISTDGYLGSSQQLYMTKENLYLTAAAYMPIEEDEVEGDMAVWIPQQANTEIFKFALEGIEVRFVASREVTGSLLNQFSMDEYNGYFRVVTTEGFAWDEASPSKNHLFILDGEMKQVGSVEDLAPGERIYSARFMQDMAYMVTFKETDPLFVIDVSTPSAPEVLGELKIPGFSNYLHPLGENHLIGFGSDTKLEPVKGDEPRVVTGGMKISLFDISDFSNPQEKDTEIIGGQGTYSALQYDHKALFTHEEKNLYGFPVAVYEETEEEYVEFDAEGAMIYTINTDGITEAADLLNRTEGQYEDWSSSVQRILYIDETLFTVANSEVKSYRLDNFELISSLKYAKSNNSD